MASAIEREWLDPTASGVAHAFDSGSGTVRASARDYYGAIVLAEHPVKPDPLESSTLLGRAYLERGLTAADYSARSTSRICGTRRERVGPGCPGGGRASIALRGRSRGKPVVERAGRPRQAGALAATRSERPIAPAGLRVRRLGLRFREGAGAFGLAETPAIGPRREPVLLRLLAPNGRPVQMTRDLRSFWERTYRRSARSCAAAIRSTPGPRIRGMRRRRRAPRRRGGSPVRREDD